MASELVERLAKKRHALCYIQDASQWEDGVDEVRFYINAIADESERNGWQHHADWLRAQTGEE